MHATPLAPHSRACGNPPSSAIAATKEEKLNSTFCADADEEVITAQWSAEDIQAAKEDGWDLSTLKSPPARIVKVEVCAPLTVRVEFDDGVGGNVRFEESHLEGVFAPLKKPAFFDRAFNDHGALAWSEELDMCPDAIYMQIVKNGEWVLR